MESNSWSKYSNRYNGPSGEAMTLPLIKSAFEALWFPQLDKMIAKKNNLPLKLLLLACGTGAEVEVPCSRYSKDQMSILATDYAEGMVQTTQSYIERMNKQDMVTTKVMDAMDSSYFDVVFLIMGPMLMPDPDQVFPEIQRVLVRDGWSGFLTPGKMEVHDVMSQAKKEILKADNREQEFKSFYDSEMVQKWGTPEALNEKLRDVHFQDIEATILTFLFDNPGMVQMYEGDLLPQQVGLFREKVRAAFHENWPISKAPLPASPYMTANAAIGYKRS